MTNNGLESLNAQIKLTGTFREQLSIKEFFARAIKIANDWSKERNPLIEAYYCTFICQKVGLVKVLKIPQKYKRKNSLIVKLLKERTLKEKLLEKERRLPT